MGIMTDTDSEKSDNLIDEQVKNENKYLMKLKYEQSEDKVELEKGDWLFIDINRYHMYENKINYSLTRYNHHIARFLKYMNKPAAVARIILIQVLFQDGSYSPRIVLERKL